MSITTASLRAFSAAYTRTAPFAPRQTFPKHLLHNSISANSHKRSASLHHHRHFTVNSATSARMEDITYLTQKQAQALDADLMGELHFSIDQLMELAGLSVASALHLEYGASKFKRVLILVGPGNNGGDGLVAARHLWQFGHTVEVCYPKRTDKPLFHNLVAQCEAHNIAFLEPHELSLEPGKLAQRADVVLDALFGFSFKGPPRAPLDKLLEVIKPAAKPPPVVSVDIPSGWDVEQGDANGDGIKPDMLVSLTAPKLAAKSFTGTHYLGGRFVPPGIRDKYHLKLPQYPGVMECIKIQ